MGLIEDIKSKAKSSTGKRQPPDKKGKEVDPIKQANTTEAMVIESTLNKLFYMKPDVHAEADFVSMVLQKNGANLERYGLHASAIIVGEKEFCYREQVLSLFYKQAQGHNIPIRLKRIFEEGNAIHEKWQRLFIRGKLGVKEDMDRSRFNSRYDLSFTPDGIVTIAGHVYVAEIKSCNTYTFKSMTSHPSGAKQLLFYMLLTGIERGFVLAEDKNTQEFKIFVYHLDKEKVKVFVERLREIQVHKKAFIEEKSMVARCPECTSHTSKRAEKCNMKDACFNVGMGRVKLCTGE
jgi:hypothetical protein